MTTGVLPLAYLAPPAGTFAFSSSNATDLRGATGWASPAKSATCLKLAPGRPNGAMTCKNPKQ